MGRIHCYPQAGYSVRSSVGSDARALGWFMSGREGEEWYMRCKREQVAWRRRFWLLFGRCLVRLAAGGPIGPVFCGSLAVGARTTNDSRLWPICCTPFLLSTRSALSALLTAWYIDPLNPSGHYMHRQFNIQQLYVLPTQCIYVFCVDLRTNSDYFPIKH